MKHRRKIAGILLALLLLSGCGKAAQSSAPEQEVQDAATLLQFDLPKAGDDVVVIKTSMGTVKVMRERFSG